MFSGNRRNVPKTIAKRYQIKDHAERDPEITLSEPSETYNVCIKAGDTIVAAICPVMGEPIFAIVDRCPDAETFVCRLYDTVFDRHFYAYRVRHISQDQVTMMSRPLLYRLPVSRVRTSLNIQYLCLRHAIV